MSAHRTERPKTGMPQLHQRYGNQKILKTPVVIIFARLPSKLIKIPYSNQTSIQ